MNRSSIDRKNPNQKVSVVIPFFSRVDWLKEATESVLNQSYKNYEMIVVNDGSREDLSDFLRAFRHKINFISKENGGPGSARNVGIENAKGEYIAFLDSDDLWLENKLEKQVALMNETGAVWSHTSYVLFKDGEKRKYDKKINVSSYQGNVFPKCLLSAPIATPCVMIKTRFLKENSDVRFPENMRYGQDSLFWITMATRNPLAVVPEPLTQVRMRGENAARRARVQLQVKGQIWEYINQNRLQYSGKGKADYLMRMAYKICFAENKFISSMEKKRYIGRKVIEQISRMLYSFPYAVLKAYYVFIWKNKKNSSAEGKN